MTHADPPAHPMGPDSSAGSTEERSVLNREAGRSTRPQGSTYLYAVVRKELASGALLAQFGHAVTECLLPEDLPLPKDTRIVVLGATKEQMASVLLELAALQAKGERLSVAGIVETDGPLAGSATALGLLTRDRDGLRARVPALAELRPWREPK